MGDFQVLLNPKPYHDDNIPATAILNYWYITNNLGPREFFEIGDSSRFPQSLKIKHYCCDAVSEFCDIVRH